ncbi:MAG: S41 family peptidase [Armatimonadota bacterium]
MNTKIKVVGSWLLLAVVAGSAFYAGSDLRSQQFFHLPEDNKSVQASALLKLTPEWSPVAVKQSKQNPTEDRTLFRNVYNLVKAHYVDPVTPETEASMARGAVKGMIDALGDPDSRFMDPSERKLLDDAGSGRFYGIGAILTLKREKIKNGETTIALQDPSKNTEHAKVLQDNNISKLDIVKIIIVSPMPGSPADKAGLRAGDSITYINNKWIITSDPFLMANMDKLARAVRNKEVDEFEYQKAFETAEKRLKDGMDIPEALETLTAKSSGEITVRVERAGVKNPIEVKLQCTETHVNPIESKTIKPGIEYLRISQFNKTAADVFAKEINKAQASKAKGLIIDLRNNPGGLISSGVSIAGKITGGGKLGTVIETSRNRVINIPKSTKVTMPIVVLVNNGTASVAELVASALKENSSAVLVGLKTFGDGLTQTPLILKDGSAAVLTTGRMLTSKGIDFNGKGISPDKVIVQSSKTADSQLDEAQRILLAKIGKA